MSEEEVLECIDRLLSYLNDDDAIESERIENGLYLLEERLKYEKN